MDKYIGKTLDDRYEIKEIIGVGGMANVYKATDTREGRTVAVKILREEHLQDEEVLRRFRNESKAIAVLNHPNIIKVYDMSFTGGDQYIVMELVDGITLKEYIEQQKRLRWKEAVHFTVQILRALQHAHDKGIVHRDIKPQNIMLLSDGTIKVADFGIARFSRASQQTVTDKAIGSVHYISPEQAKGEPTDQKSDLYSLGVMLYEMTTGTLPFDAESPVTIALKQIQAQPKLPRELNPEIPEGLQDIIVRAMQKDPAKRYQTAAEMLRDIDEFKRDPSVSFEYKYTESETETISENFEKAEKKTEKIKDEQVRKGAPIVPVLTGVTIAFIIVAIIFVIGIMVMVRPFEEVPDTTAPSLVGMNINEAQKTYRDFDIVVESSAFHDVYDKDIIYDQSVNPDMVVKKGSTIKVKISSGLSSFVLSSFEGADENELYTILADNDIEFTTITESSTSIPEGCVIRTEPGAGSEVDPGTVVIVYVSSGMQVTNAVVPNVIGYKLSDAKLLLNAAGVRINSVVRVDSDQPSNVVLDQSIGAGTSVPRNSTIALTAVIDRGDENAVVDIFVSLPTRSKTVAMKATLNGNDIADEMVSLGSTSAWKVSFSGEGIQTAIIYMDDQVYKTYQINFTDQTSMLLVDNSAGF